MKLKFDYRGTIVTYYLTYKKTKAISINVSEEGEVHVTAPIGTSVYAVMDKVKGNAPWIIRELYQKQGSVEAVQEIKLLEHYTYLGKNYKLETVLANDAKVPKVKMMRGKFIIETASENPAIIREAIVGWYKEKVTAKLKERLKVYKEFFEVLPSTVEIADKSSTLFGANEKGFVVNVRMGILPSEVIDYLIVAGLCSLNGIKDNKAMLEKVLPNYEKSISWLEENKGKLVL